MKLEELLTEEQLNELNLRKALATGALAASAAFAPNNATTPNEQPPSAEQVAAQRKAYAELEQRRGIDKLAQIAMSKYKGLSPTEAKEIAALATKYAKPSFPKAADILSIIGIESSFRPEAVSGLKKDPARGLMQVRPKTWGMDIEALAKIEDQIRIGTDILHKYFKRVGDKESAVHAYNIGMRNFLNQTGLNPKYVTKFNKERQLYDQNAPVANPKAP